MLALLYHKYGKLKEITHNVGVRLYENNDSTVVVIQGRVVQSWVKITQG